MGMSMETKRIVDLAPAVDRMGVYEFLEKDMVTVKKYCVVVSGDHRKRDRYVSIIVLSDCEGDTGYHGDEIGIRLPIGDFWVHCGILTYVRRDRLGMKVGKVGQKTRKKINKMISMEMGLQQKDRDIVFAENEPDWKDMYYSLMHKALQQGVILGGSEE